MWPTKPQNIKLHLHERHGVFPAMMEATARSPIFCHGVRQDEVRSGFPSREWGRGISGCVKCQGLQTRKNDLRHCPLPCFLGIPVSAWEPLIWGSPESAHKCFLILFLSPLYLVHVIAQFLRKDIPSSQTPLSLLLLLNKGHTQTRSSHCRVSVKLGITLI